MTNAITITRKANTLYAPYLPHAAYKALVQLAKDHDGEIVVNADHTIRIDFNEVGTAKNVVEKFRADYKANKKPTSCVWDDPEQAYYESVMDAMPAKKPTSAKGKKADFVTVTVNGVKYTVDKANLVPTAPAKKTTPAKGSKKPTAKKADKTTAPKRAKGGFDFGSIKGKTNTDKNKALHAVLVGMGMKDSRAKEYQAVWNARPWAK
jgi:hypothetical protein